VWSEAKPAKNFAAQPPPLNDTYSSLFSFIKASTSILMETLTKDQDAGSVVEGFLQDVQFRVPLRKAISNIATAGSAIIPEKRIQANEEIFRISQPLVSVT
jgi:hypothetical protein